MSQNVNTKDQSNFTIVFFIVLGIESIVIFDQLKKFLVISVIKKPALLLVFRMYFLSFYQTNMYLIFKSHFCSFLDKPCNCETFKDVCAQKQSLMIWNEKNKTIHFSMEIFFNGKKFFCFIYNVFQTFLRDVAPWVCTYLPLLFVRSSFFVHDQGLSEYRSYSQYGKSPQYGKFFN